MQAAIDRFWAKVKRGHPNECWLWLGSYRGKGYGYFRWNGKSAAAHRIAWEISHGPLLKVSGHHGICVLHRCDNPKCVNPAHLFLGTNHDNALDRDRKGRNKIKPRTKLTHEQVQAIRDLRGRFTRKTLGLQFGVHETTIERIHWGISWKNS